MNNEPTAAAERVQALCLTDVTLANAVAQAPFDDIPSMFRFVAWYEEPGQIPSGWDTTKYRDAQLILAYADLKAQDDLAAKYRDLLGYIEEVTRRIPGDGLLAIKVNDLVSQAESFSDNTIVDGKWLHENHWHNDGDGCLRPPIKTRIDIMWYLVSGWLYVQGKQIGQVTRGQVTHLIAALKE
jgi:hypothetical protein